MELPVVLIVEDGSHYKDTEERSQERKRGLLPTPALHFYCTPDEKGKGLAAENQDPGVFSSNSHQRKSLDLGFADRATWNDE